MIYHSSLNPCLTRKIDYDVNYRRRAVQYLVVQGLDAWFGTEKEWRKMLNMISNMR